MPLSIDDSNTTALKLILDSEFETLEQLVDVTEEFADNQSLSEDLRDRILVAVSEASSNAMRHGNKFDPNKVVTVHLIKRDGAIEIMVQDEGQGFVRERVADPLLPENLFKTSGRGLFLIEELADEVRFADGGRQLNMIFRERGGDG